MALKTDDKGIVQEGRFAGRHIDEVETYLEGLEAAISSEDKPAGEKKEPPKAPVAKTPEQILEEQNRARLDPLQQMTVQRMVADDEAAAKAEFADYAKYEERINALRKTVPVGTAMQRGFHRTAYMNIKMQDPEVQKLVREYGKQVTETEEQKVAREAEEERVRLEAEEAEKKEPPKREPTKPRASPPAQPPTPPARGEKQQPAKPKLVANDKLRAFCKRQGRDINEYLLQLEKEGRTQDEIDTMGTLGQRNVPGRVQLAYDRPVAKR